MDAIYSTHGHPTPETLEEYAFQRLSEADTEGLEEHLLMCGKCQHALAEIDEYILLMKVATAAPQKPVFHGAGLRGWWYAAGGIAMATAMVLAIALWPVSHAGPVQTVQLLALRGGDQAINHVRAGQPVDLKMDLSGLPQEESRYRVELVSASGAPWIGPAKSAIRVKRGTGTPRARSASRAVLGAGVLHAANCCASSD